MYTLARTRHGRARIGHNQDMGREDRDTHEDETSELRVAQERREDEEKRLAEEESTEAGTKTHERRAAKAAYLKQKLAERERAERER